MAQGPNGATTRTYIHSSGKLVFTNASGAVATIMDGTSDAVLKLYRADGTTPKNIESGNYRSMPGVASGAGNLSEIATGEARTVWQRYDWNNSNIANLGAVTSANVKICTLPARTIVTNAVMILTTGASGALTIAASIGSIGPNYTNLLGSSSLKAADGTVYGLPPASADLLALSVPTDVYLRVVSTVGNLNITTGSSGTIYLETAVLP